MTDRGKGGTKMHRKVLKDNNQGITKPANTIGQFHHRGGVKRITGLIYEVHFKSWVSIHNNAEIKGGGSVASWVDNPL